MTQPAPEISFVLPAHNEARNVQAMTAALARIAAPLGRYEIVFVNDGSSDGTLAEIKAAAARDDRVRYVSFTRNFGHQAALRAGLRHARGRAAVVMDCDFEHPPETIPALAAEWRRGAQIVVTLRKEMAGPGSAFKRVTSRLFYRLLNAIGDVQIDPGSADFMLLDRAAIDTINAFQDHDFFLRGLVRWLGFPLAQVHYVQGRRQEGETSYTLRRMIDLAVTGIVAHSLKPLRLAIHLALGFALLGVLLLVYSIVSFFWIDHTVVGWSSLMAAIAILGAGQMLVLGIIGEYVGRILRDTRGWPIYIVAETDADQGAAADPGVAIYPHGGATAARA